MFLSDVRKGQKVRITSPGVIYQKTATVVSIEEPSKIFKETYIKVKLDYPYEGQELYSVTAEQIELIRAF